jgi:hypothetical protein
MVHVFSLCMVAGSTMLQASRDAFPVHNYPRSPLSLHHSGVEGELREKIDASTYGASHTFRPPLSKLWMHLSHTPAADFKPVCVIQVHDSRVSLLLPVRPPPLQTTFEGSVSRPMVRLTTQRRCSTPSTPVKGVQLLRCRLGSLWSPRH